LDGAERRFYRCGARVNGRSPGCRTSQVACWRIDDVVLETVREQVLEPDYIKAEIERANARLMTKSADVSVQMRQVEQSVKEREKGVIALLKLVEKMGLTSVLEKQYGEANAAYLDAITRLAKLRSESVQSQVRQIAFADVQRSLDDFVKVLDEGTIRQKQELVRRFVERVYVYPERLHIKLSFGLDEIIKLPELEVIRAGESYVSQIPQFSRDTKT